MASVFELTARTVRSFYGMFLDTPPVLDIDEYFPEARILEEHWLEMREEVLGLLGDWERIPLFHELLEDQAEISANDGHDWRMLVLSAYGADQHANQERCPKTARLIRSIPTITSATFSILEAKKHIPAHRGPYRGILRYQLGLVIPVDEDGGPAAILRVDDQRYRWREGEGILWDDTYEHEVWNQGDSRRVILLLDVLRPHMPWLLRGLHRVIYGTVLRSKGLQDFLARSEVPARTLEGTAP